MVNTRRWRWRRYCDLRRIARRIEIVDFGILGNVMVDSMLLDGQQLRMRHNPMILILRLMRRLWWSMGKRMLLMVVVVVLLVGPSRGVSRLLGLLVPGVEEENRHDGLPAPLKLSWSGLCLSACMQHQRTLLFLTLASQNSRRPSCKQSKRSPSEVQERTLS